MASIETDLFLPDAPINFDAPINDKLLLHYLVTRQSAFGGEGNVWRNLNQNFIADGALTTSPIWSEVTHPGGCGSLYFSGGARIDMTLPASTTTYTLAFWMRPDATPSDYHCLFGPPSGNGLYYNSGKVNLYYGGDHFNTTTLTAKVWAHVTVSVNAGNVTFYINAKPDGTATGATTFTPAKIGNNNDGQSFTGYMNDFRFYLGRSLSGNDVMQIYTASLAGFPNEFNYQRPVRLGASAVATGNRRRRIICGAAA